MWVLVPLMILLGGAGSHAFVTGGCLYLTETRRTPVLQQLPVFPLKTPTTKLRSGSSTLRCCMGSAKKGEDNHGRGRRLESPEPRATAWHSSLVPRTLACAIALVTAGLPSAFVDQGFLSPPGGVFLSRSVVPSASAAPVARLEETSNAEQIAGGLSPVNTVRGVWRIRETRTDGSTLPQEPGKLSSKGICRGRLSFKGFVGSGKGTVDYKMCGDREGKGRWLTKPKNIINRRITLSARWKVTFRDGTSLLYRGDVFREEGEELPLRVAIEGGAGPGSVGFERPNAHIRGDVYEPVTLPQGTLTEKKIGEFEADLIELPTDEDRL